VKNDSWSPHRPGRLQANFMQAMKTPEARTAATHDVVGHSPFGTPRVCATALDAKASAALQ
jgi:hypothetical protein